jgi:hypothetical protein
MPVENKKYDPDRIRKIYKKLNKLFKYGPVIKQTAGKTLRVKDVDLTSRLPHHRSSFKKVAYFIYQNYMAYDITRRNRYAEYDYMEITAEIGSALDILADDATTRNDEGDLLNITSENPEIKETLENLFKDILNIEFNLFSWVRNCCKYGDYFLMLDVDPINGVMGAHPIPPVQVERMEGYDSDNPYAYKFQIIGLAQQDFQNWEVVHFRLLNDTMFLPYGKSQIEGARKIWKQLNLIEDAMLVYRITRAPERRVFKIDVAGINPQDVPIYIEETKNRLKKAPLIDQSTGQLDYRYNPLSVDEDYFLPIRGQQSSTIETLPGGQNINDIEDVHYMRSKLFSALKIPKAYLQFEEDLNGKATLCLKLDTKIPLLDGRTLSLEDIIKEHSLGKKLYAYSCDTNRNMIIPGEISWAGITRKNTKVKRIWFDNNTYLDCTDNHELVMKNGIKKQVCDISIGE